MTDSPKNNIDYTNLSYEEAFTKLKLVVEKIQQNDVSLEEVVKLYKEGKLLSNRCEQLLNSAKFEIEEVMKSDSNNE